MAISLSDYTLGIGQGWSVDELLKEHPELAGSVLQPQTRDVTAGDVEWELPPGTLLVAARDTASGVWTDLRRQVAGGVLKWRAPSPQQLLAVFARAVQPSLDPMNPQAGPLYAREFFGQFEDRYPGEGGKGLNFFFSDELGFGVGGDLWTARFAEEFPERANSHDICGVDQIFGALKQWIRFSAEP